MTNKVVRGYSLSLENIQWLKRRAAGRALLADESVSTSAVLDELLDKAREADKTQTLTLPSPKTGEGKAKGKA